VTRLRSLAILGGAAIIALVAGFAANEWRMAPDPLGSGLSAEADVAGLMAARLPMPEGGDASLAQWRGRVLVVNFWATWCAPCREEIPDFIELQGEFGPKGVQFVGIAADQMDKVGAYGRELGINYPILVGDYAALSLARQTGNKIEALPYTIVLDRQGRLVHRQLGVLKPQRLREIFAKIL
jgi:thiol-disulfide isomerase/thioredoxin